MISNQSLDLISGDGWRLSWSSDVVGATFTVFQDGKRIGTTKATFMEVTIAPDAYPIFDIFDDESIPPRRFQDRAQLNWYASAGAAEYVVEQFVDGAWVLLERVPDRGERYFQWFSAVLADSVTHRFGVTPIGTNGGSGTRQVFDIPMIRNPDPPIATMSYSAATQKITIT